MATLQQLQDAYQGIYNGQELPIKLIKQIIQQLKSFLLGDGTRNIQIISSDTDNQAELNQTVEDIKLLEVLELVYDDVLVAGEGYIDVSGEPLRRIPIIDVDEAVVDPDNYHKLVYLKYKLKRYNSEQKSTTDIEVEHSLELPTTTLSNPIDLLAAPDYEYVLRVDGEEVQRGGNEIPIIRLLSSLDGTEAESPIEPLIHPQLEYNELRARINVLGKHQKPILYSIGTSAPKVIGKSNKAKPDALSSQEGQYVYQTSFSDEAAVMLHFPIGTDSMEAAITPKVGYLQAIDSNYLERQRLIVLQDIYNLCGAVVLELQNARTASSSSSLRILYEPLVKFTAERAKYLKKAIKLILNNYGIDFNTTPYRIEMPDMRPADLNERIAKAELVEKRIISRKRFLMETVGLSPEEADLEIEQLITESVINVQYSAAEPEENQDTQDNETDNNISNNNINEPITNNNRNADEN